MFCATAATSTTNSVASATVILPSENNLTTFGVTQDNQKPQVLTNKTCQVVILTILWMKILTKCEYDKSKLIWINIQLNVDEMEKLFCVYDNKSSTAFNTNKKF